MARRSNISWTDASWNFVTGCTLVSPGCDHCYARTMAMRLHKAGNPRYRNGFEVTIHWDRLKAPLHWDKPSLIFVNSMSDLFHKDVPEEVILAAYDVMRQADWHIYQILTKRPRRLLQLAPRLPQLPHVWLGTSVESQHYVWRIDVLRQAPAAVHFVSFEPLLGPIAQVDLSDIEWVIVGGESGPGFRPMDPRWAMGIQQLCASQNIPFYFKQIGGRHCNAGGHLLNGRAYREFPPQYYQWMKDVVEPWRPGLYVRRGRQGIAGVAHPARP